MAKAKDSSEGRGHDQPWLWVHRVGVTPVFVSTMVLAYALGLSLAGPAIPVVWAVLVTLGISASLWAIAKRKWGGSKKVKDKQLYRYVEALIITCTAAVITMKVYAEFTWDWVLWFGGAWIILTLLFGSFWWNDKTNLVKIKVQEDMLRWPEVANKIGMASLHKSQIFQTETGSRVRLWWDKGTLTSSRVRGQQDVLEQLFGAPEGSAKFLPVVDADGNKDGTQLDMVWNDKAPGRKEAIPFTEPTATSVLDKILLGLREDGEEVWMSMCDAEYGVEHILVGGTTGSGKSGLYHLLLGETADVRDMVRWGMDFKGGMAFRPWGPLFDWLITDEEDTLAMFTAARAVLEARAKYAARRGWKTWQPDKKHPLLVIFIDEAAIPFGMTNYEIIELGKIIAQQGRATGVKLCLATQHATNESVGSQQINKNLNYRFAFRCTDMSQQGVLLPNGHGVVDATAIPSGKAHAGKCYWSEGGVIDKLMMRVRYVTEEKIRELVEKFWEFRCDLDRGSAKAARKATVRKEGGNAFDERKIWTIEDLGDPDLWEGDDHIDPDLIWDEILNEDPDHPAPKEPGLNAREFIDSGLPGENDLYEPAELPEEEPAMPYDETKGSVAYSDDFLKPTDPTARAEHEREVEAFLASRADRYTATEARDRFHEALLAAGARGIKFEDLQAYCGRKSTWVNDEILKHVREDKTIHSPAHGYWAYTETELSRLAMTSSG